MPYQIWKCSICDKEYKSKKEAVACEKQKVEPPQHKIGDVVLVKNEYEQNNNNYHYLGGSIIKETVERTVIGVELGCSPYAPDGGMHDWYVILGEEISELKMDDEGNEYYDTTDQILEYRATPKKP